MSCASRFVMLFVLIFVFLAGIAQGMSEAESEAAFRQLASLVGEWNGSYEGAGISASYTLTADGSALMEEFRPASKPVMVTMFSVDGDHLVATHYCSAGNQPQMRTKTIADAKANVLAFSLVRITGMKSPGDWHNTGLEIHLEDNDHLTQIWSWKYQGKAGTTVFHFARKKT